MPMEDDGNELFLYDQPYSVEEILVLLQPIHDTIYLDGTGLSDSGLDALLNGLDEFRNRYKHFVDGGAWGLSQIFFAEEGITDVGLAAILKYANRDHRLKRLHLAGTSIELRAHPGHIVRLLNSSTLSTFTLSDHSQLFPAGVSCLIHNMSSPALHTLRLNRCGLGSEVTDDVIAFLGAARSRTITMLDLIGHDIGVQASRRIIDTIERRNFTLRHFGILVGDISSYHFMTRRLASRIPPEEKADVIAGLERLARCMERNKALGVRVVRAAQRCLPIARIILNDISLAAKRRSSRQRAQKGGSARSQAGAVGFRLMDLPLDIIDLVVRHTSGDAAALSDAQYARVRKEVIGKGELREAVKVAGKGRAKTMVADAQDKARREWLERQGLDRWDSEVRH